jgi:hypothetical protein
MAPKLLLACVALGLSLVGCQKKAPPPGKSVGLTALCSEADGSRVRLTGYVRYRRGMFSSCDTFSGHKTCELALYEAPDAPPDFDLMHPSKGPEPMSARLSVPVGDGPGEMKELPERFSAADVSMHLADQATASEGGHVTIDGKLSVVPGDPKTTTAPSCFVNVEWAFGVH